MNEGVGRRQRETLEFEALVVEVGAFKGDKGDDVPFTCLWLGRFIEPLTLFRNGMTVGEKVKVSGELVETSVTYRSGKARRVSFVANPAVVA